MFFKVFLLMIVFAKVSSFIAEQDYYKHYSSDDYDGYEYEDDGADEQTDKPVDRTTNIFKETFKLDASKETDKVPKRKQSKQTLIEEDENKSTLEPVTSKNTKPTTSIDIDDDITYILTDKPAEVDNNLPSYEVTENVDDIPNTVTFKPIVTNFTIKVPLNIATITNNSNEINNSGEKRKGSNLRRNSISIFHVNAEFDDIKENRPVIHNINIHKIPFGIFKVKDHVDKIKENVLNYVHSTDVNEETDHEYYLPNILAAPKHFLNVLREKGSALFHKIF